MATLFVDGNQRLPACHKPLKVTSKRGVAHENALFPLLIGQKKLAEFMQAGIDRLENLTLGSRDAIAQRRELLQVPFERPSKIGQRCIR